MFRSFVQTVRVLIHSSEYILFGGQVPTLKPGSTETRSRKREEKMGNWLFGDHRLWGWSVFRAP
jgi:hypothetical protein